MKNFAVIFDLNGTLIDTEIAHFQGYKEALEEHDVQLSIEQFTDNWSRQGKKLNDFLENIGRTDLVPMYKEIKRRKDDVFQATLSERIALMPGAVEILQMLQEASVPIGLDTSGSAENMEEMLSMFHMNKYFTHYANGDTKIDEEKYGNKKWKESRLAYLADLFEFPSTSCIMIGDAEKDIKGAKKAGMKAIAVPNQYTRENDFSLADVLYSSLSEVTFSAIELLL